MICSVESVGIQLYTPAQICNNKRSEKNFKINEVKKYSVERLPAPTVYTSRLLVRTVHVYSVLYYGI